MIACDRCRKRVESVNALRGTSVRWNEIQIFKEYLYLCEICWLACGDMKSTLFVDVEASAKQEAARRMAEWMSSREVTHDPWSEVPNES